MTFTPQKKSLNKTTKTMKKIVLVLSAMTLSLSSFAIFNVENAMRQETVGTLRTGRKTATSGVGSNTSNMNQDTVNNSRTGRKMGKMNGTMDASSMGGKNGKMHGSTSDGFMMKDGKMWVIKNRKTSPMNAEVTLDNGIRVMTDGTCMHKNGTTMRLKNGESIGMNGKMISMKKNKMK